jgi:hypothetical protein|tara:strand:+ start:303 stop:506 length:204 start_codon:yes stop_codon:yes gene_type:complete
MKKYLGIIISFILLTGCSEFAMLTSGSSIALSNNLYVKTYSGLDFLTVISTEDDIKTHAYRYLQNSH